MSEMVDQNLREFYDSDENFKAYVDKYCVYYRISLDVALTHKLVKETALFYKERRN